jgi:uncharacterized protein with HEPN domain
MPLKRLSLPFRGGRTHWADIHESIGLIEAFPANHNLEMYRSDPLVKSAVERQMQIISEAAGRLGLEAEDQCPDLDWKGLRGMGNVLRHAYHRIDDRIVWDAVKEDLPLLKACVDRIMAVQEADPGSQ